MMTPESFPEQPPDRRDERRSGGDDNNISTVEMVHDVADVALEAADVTCEVTSCFDALPDCSVIDCDPGCL
jgi:hypothetical protein